MNFGHFIHQGTTSPPNARAGTLSVFATNSSGILYTKNENGVTRVLGQTHSGDITTYGGTVTTSAVTTGTLGSTVYGATGRVMGDPITFLRFYDGTGRILYVPAYQGI